MLSSSTALSFDLSGWGAEVVVVRQVLGFVVAWLCYHGGAGTVVFRMGTEASSGLLEQESEPERMLAWLTLASISSICKSQMIKVARIPLE